MSCRENSYNEGYGHGLGSGVILTILFGLCVLLLNKCQPDPQPAYRQVSATELTCMAHAVYHEARGEPFSGQVAVAYVVKNRASGDDHPDHFCNVVYQPHQFTNIRSTTPKMDSSEWKAAIKASLAAVTGSMPDPTKGARYFYAPDKVSKPKWAKSGVQLASIGGHQFYDLQR